MTSLHPLEVALNNGLVAEAFKNQSQLDELKIAPRNLFNARLGHTSSNPLGIETPLGHAYAVFLEIAEEQRRAQRKARTVPPDPQGFIAAITTYFQHQGDISEANAISLTRPTFYPSHARAFLHYMIHHGLTSANCARVMQEVLGPNTPYEFDEAHIRRERRFILHQT